MARASRSLDEVLVWSGKGSVAACVIEEICFVGEKKRRASSLFFGPVFDGTFHPFCNLEVNKLFFRRELDGHSTSAHDGGQVITDTKISGKIAPYMVYFFLNM